MQLDDLAKLCCQQLINVVAVVQENIVSLLDLCVVYEEMKGGSFLEMRGIFVMRYICSVNSSDKTSCVNI